MDNVQTRHSKQLIPLGPEDGFGAQAELRRHANNPAIAAKVFPNPLEQDLVDKLDYLIAKPVVASSPGHRFALPIDVVCDPANDKPRGFLLEYAHGAIDFDLVIAATTWLPEAFRIRVALNLTNSLNDLHHAGYCRGDFPNSMVMRDGSIVEIDLDSLQIGTEFRCGLAKLPYLAPELLQHVVVDKGSMREVDITPEHDRFAHAVQLWKLVRGNGDEHPFASHYTGNQTPPPSRVDRVLQGKFPWSGQHPDFQPPNDAPSLREMDGGLRMLFFQTFEDGCHSASRRPSVISWRTALAAIDLGDSVELTAEEWQCIRDGRRPVIRVNTLRDWRIRRDDAVRIAVSVIRRIPIRLVAGSVLAMATLLFFRSPIQTSVPESRSIDGAYAPHVSSASVESTTVRRTANRHRRRESAWRENWLKNIPRAGSSGETPTVWHLLIDEE